MRERRGFILPMVIFSLAIMGVLLLIMVSSSDDDRLGSRYEFEGTRSFYAAESGLANILTTWKANNYEGAVPNVGDTTTVAWTNLGFNAGSYHATIVKVESATYMITVDGRTPGARKGLRTVQMMLTPGTAFNYALLAGSDMKLHPAKTDSWDSDLGTYASQTPGSNGDVRSNNTVSQFSESPPTSVINGDLYAASNNVIAGCSAPNLTGTCNRGASTVPMPSVACPASFSTAADVGSWAGYVPGTGVLKVQGGSTLTVDYANSPYSFSDVTISPGTLTFTGTPQHVDIYVSGALTLSGGNAIVNPSAKPTNLTIWGCGANNSNWVVQGGANAYFAMYAPFHKVTLSGTSPVYGAIAAGSLDLSGGSTLHYDEALARQPSIILVPGSWTEIAR